VQRAKNGRGAASASGHARSSDLSGGIGTISTDRQEGDIRESGCPAVRTANSEPKPARKTTRRALANIKFTQMNQAGRIGIVNARTLAEARAGAMLVARRQAGLPALEARYAVTVALRQSRAMTLRA
jgi:hypothetical protein